MPNWNGRGPYGAGPRTGRGLGLCNGYAVSGYETGWRGRFAMVPPRYFRVRRGYGAGFYRYPNETIFPVEYDDRVESENLSVYAESLSKELEIVKKRIEELEAKKKDNEENK